jgi:hypothetical protein
MDKFHYENPIDQQPMMAQHLIDITVDDPSKKHKYGIPMALDEFKDLLANLTCTAAAAAKLEVLPTNHTKPATITAIYEPEDGFKDRDILNIEMSLDIFGPSAMESIHIDTQHPTLGFEIHSTKMTARPIIKSCKSGPQTANLKNWRSRF